MKRIILGLLLCCAVCGCARTVTYSTLVQIAPAKTPGEYLVAARVREKSDGWTGYRMRERPSPILRCRPGKVARDSNVVDGLEIELEARIAKPGERKNTNCLLTVKRDGEVVAANRILLPPPPAP